MGRFVNNAFVAVAAFALALGSIGATVAVPPVGAPAAMPASLDLPALA